MVIVVVGDGGDGGGCVCVCVWGGRGGAEGAIIIEKVQTSGEGGGVQIRGILW